MNKKTVMALGASWLALTGAAYAEQAPSLTPAEREARIQALEQRLQDLETQLSDLKESTSADSADIRRLQTDAVQVTVNNGRPQFATSDGAFKVALRGLFQYDVAHYDEDNTFSNAQVTDGALRDFNSGANFRRARIGIEGTAFSVWNYALTYEQGGSGRETVDNGLQQAWVEYAGWKPFGLTDPVRFRGGAFAVENTLEGATNNTDSLFLERASIAEIVRSTFGGDGRYAFGVYANGDRLSVSGVLTGSRIADNTTNDEQEGFVTRVGWLPLRGENFGVHIGANYSAITQLPGNAPNSITFSDRPELRVDGTTLISANLGAGAESARAYGLELGGQFGRFYVAGEYLTIDVERTGVLSDPSLEGYYVQGSWVLTGEKRAWNRVSGGFGGIRPTNNFDLSTGKWGAWEIAARYSFADLNDNEGAAGIAAGANNIRGGEQTITSLGLNWYPNSVVRFLLQAQDVDVERLGATGVQIGQDYNSLALRTQVSF
ncbi:MAG: porin [Caulobacterales bacterium]